VPDDLVNKLEDEKKNWGKKKKPTSQRIIWMSRSVEEKEGGQGGESFSRKKGPQTGNIKLVPVRR